MLPVVIFVSSVVSVLFYWGVMQYLIRKLAWVMQVTMATTAAESLNVAANIFIGGVCSCEFLRSMKPSVGYVPVSPCGLWSHAFHSFFCKDGCLSVISAEQLAVVVVWKLIEQRHNRNEMKWNEKCSDLKCVRKPTRSRLSLTHHANKSSRWAE